MKTKAKSTAKSNYGKTSTSPTKSKKRVENRDLNEDDQRIITNASVDDTTDEERYQITPPDDVEQDEDREKKRRVEDARGEEED
jgi:hypothetical protein